VAASAIACALAALPARGDVPGVVASGPAGPFTVTVLADPAPLRVGPIELRVVVQAVDDAKPIPDARVAVRLERVGGPRSADAAIELEAEPEPPSGAAYSMRAPLVQAGTWRATVSVERGRDRGTLATEIRVDDAPRTVAALWPYLAAPFAALALYALQQALARRLGRT